MTDTIIMYDSDNVDDIPADAGAVMFYNDGEPGTPTAAQLERFAGRSLVPITRKVGVKAKVVDVESGCVWPPTEARQQIQSGDSDTVYCNLNDWQTQVKEDLAGLQFNLIIAEYDGNAEIPVFPGVNCVGKQFCSPTEPPQAPSGGHYDKSVVSTVWLGIQPAPPEDGMHAPPESPPNDPIEAADGKMVLSAPIVDAIWVAGGCYMVAADGGVFTRDAAVFHGSIPQLQGEGKVGPLHADVCTIVAQDHTGYTLIAEDGGTFRFGNGPDIQAL